MYGGMHADAVLGWVATSQQCTEHPRLSCGLSFAALWVETCVLLFLGRNVRLVVCVGKVRLTARQMILLSNTQKHGNG